MSLYEQLQTLLAWGVLFSFLGILAAGMSNRVVIFYDKADFIWTLSPFLSLVVGGIVASTLVPEGGDLTPAAIGVMGVALLLALYGIAITFVNSVRHNGVAIGIIVGIFKILSSVLAAVISLGTLYNAFKGSDSSLGKRLLVLLLFGLLAWTLTRLINGEAVYARRAQLHK